MPPYKQSGAFQRWAAVSRRLRSPFARGNGELALPKPVGRAVLAAKPLKSGECRVNKIAIVSLMVWQHQRIPVLPKLWPVDKARHGANRRPNMHYAGGWFAGLILATVFSPALADSWSFVSPMPDPKWEPAVATGGDGLVYAIGGMDASGPPSTANVFSYDPSSDTWSTAPPLPAGPRRYLGAATDFAGRIYAIAGYTPEFPLATVERYDPSLGYWTRLPDVPEAKQGLAAATGSDGRIYAIGGLPFTFRPSDRVDAYDPDSGAWTQVASLTTPRDGCAAATGPDGRIYVMGGFGNDAYLNSAEVYDPSADTWTPIAPLQSIRFALAAATGPDGRIYAIGGYDGLGDTATVEAYDPKSDTWTFVASMNTPRETHAATTGVDGTIYAVGPDASVEAYTALSWYATIRRPNGNQQKVIVQADNQLNAKQMIEAQYGRASIISGPHRVELVHAR